jgi:hypothetical protein
MMANKAERISAQNAYQHMKSNPETLLVCAYDSEEKFAQNHLDGAISLDEFRHQENSVRKDREIIFYCA